MGIAQQTVRDLTIQILIPRGLVREMQAAICWDVGGERINVVVNQQQELGCSQQSLGIESRASAFQRLSRRR